MPITLRNIKMYFTQTMYAHMNKGIKEKNVFHKEIYTLSEFNVIYICLKKQRDI
jgi:hypothetical protein